MRGDSHVHFHSRRSEVDRLSWRGAANRIFVWQARPLLDSYSKELVDPRLKMQYDEYELHCMMHAANQCVKKDPTMRPRMTQVCIFMLLVITYNTNYFSPLVVQRYLFRGSVWIWIKSNLFWLIESQNYFSSSWHIKPSLTLNEPI